MTMRFEHEFTVPVPLEQAWAVLLDVERVAPCLPGAALDSAEGDDFTGRMKVKVGPITVTYRGRASFEAVDKDAHTLTLKASGKEARGTGTATATVRAALAGEGAQTRVKVETSFNVTGRPAQFGRGVMAEVGAKLLDRFAANLAALLHESPAEPLDAATPETLAETTDAAPPQPLAETTDAAPPGTPADPTGAAAPETPAEAAAEVTAPPLPSAPATTPFNQPGTSLPDAEEQEVPEIVPVGDQEPATVTAIGAPADVVPLRGTGDQDLQQPATAEPSGQAAEEGTGQAVEEPSAQAAEEPPFQAAAPAEAATPAAGPGGGEQPPARHLTAVPDSYEPPYAKEAAAGREVHPAGTARTSRTAEEEALDLLEIAGVPVLKRVAPAVAALAAVIFLAWLVRRVLARR
ncbi:SRPBCC domain-containing protein [Sphaerisporangium rhizosphaerae]|uniref:SRPBCC domain-containing protein n=1 Tax=Sphaerisporangium rhizosphaerae TaxID=2269375 RepID=A0ABW2P602_9ACTN